MEIFNRLPQFVIPLIGGGAAGAVITVLYNHYRSRIQPIGKRIKIIGVYRHIFSDDMEYQFKMFACKDGSNVELKNLFVVEVEVCNISNKDYKSFKFGTTLTDKLKCNYVYVNTPDRHHIGKVMNNIDIINKNDKVDIVLEPFNRKDSYTIYLFVTILEGEELSDEIELTTSMPVRFVKSEAMGLSVRNTIFAALREIF